MSPPARAALLLVAGALGGALGSAGAITSLISYPALILAGVQPLAANVSNIVAGTALWPGSALASRPELRGRATWLARHLPAAAAGAAIGVALLLSTPAHSFAAIVPFLVAAGSLVLLISPVIIRRAGHASPIPDWGVHATILLVSVYAGYFGAASGVMTLALLLIAVTPRLPNANALKNMVIGAGSLIASLALIVLHPVDWATTLPLAAGMLAGSTLGPHLTRRVSPAIMRPLVAAVGLALAVQLWLGHGT
ncbi:MAG TPA: sulfite exporter TauE/SafE family protein [Solirubrobacteraceae bacterium]|nr:sulfite exporter TauE/SafE family protein [Solirubrobacteraceae bacterium]